MNCFAGPMYIARKADLRRDVPAAHIYPSRTVKIKLQYKRLGELSDVKFLVLDERERERLHTIHSEMNIDFTGHNPLALSLHISISPHSEQSFPY